MLKVQGAFDAFQVCPHQEWLNRPCPVEKGLHQQDPDPTPASDNFHLILGEGRKVLSKEIPIFSSLKECWKLQWLWATKGLAYCLLPPGTKPIHEGQFFARIHARPAFAVARISKGCPPPSSRVEVCG